jgi:ADP-ribosylglycohydrolase
LDPQLLDRAKGAMLGLAIGDALGATVEFHERDTFPLHTELTGGGVFGLPAGAWTDDTSMALCLTDSLLAKGWMVDRFDFAHRLLRWWRSGENSVTGRCFDIGFTTSAALASFDRTGEISAPTDDGSSGNGALVRTAPIAIAYGCDFWRTHDMAVCQSSVTHCSRASLSACAYLALVMGKALAAPNGARDFILDFPFSSPEIQAIGQGGWAAKSREQIQSSGYVVHTLEAALWSVAHASSFEEAVVTSVNLGDDADSVGAVAGQLAGAIWGASAIPKRWLSRIAWREHIEDKAAALLKRRERLPFRARSQARAG